MPKLTTYFARIQIGYSSNGLNDGESSGIPMQGATAAMLGYSGTAAGSGYGGSGGTGGSGGSSHWLVTHSGGARSAPQPGIRFNEREYKQATFTRAAAFQVGVSRENRRVGQESGGICLDCLNPNTVGKNLLGLTYPGGNNPKSYNGQYNYSYVPSNLAEYPAIGHDRRYDNLNIQGASGLLTNTRAIGADWKFVAEQMSIAGFPYFSLQSRAAAFGLGVGLGISALPKTIYQISTGPNWLIETMMWYQISNREVTNRPDIHKH